MLYDENVTSRPRKIPAWMVLLYPPSVLFMISSRDFETTEAASHPELDFSYFCWPTIMPSCTSDISTRIVKPARKHRAVLEGIFVKVETVTN